MNDFSRDFEVKMEIEVIKIKALQKCQKKTESWKSSREIVLREKKLLWMIFSNNQIYYNIIQKKISDCFGLVFLPISTDS